MDARGHKPGRAEAGPAQLAVAGVELDFGHVAVRTGRRFVADPAVGPGVGQHDLAPGVGGRRGLDLGQNLIARHGRNVRARESSADHGPLAPRRGKNRTRLTTASPPGRGPAACGAGGPPPGGVQMVAWIVRASRLRPVEVVNGDDPAVGPDHAPRIAQVAGQAVVAKTISGPQVRPSSAVMRARAP